MTVLRSIDTFSAFRSNTSRFIDTSMICKYLLIILRSVNIYSTSRLNTSLICRSLSNWPREYSLGLQTICRPANGSSIFRNFCSLQIKYFFDPKITLLSADSSSINRYFLNLQIEDFFDLQTSLQCRHMFDLQMESSLNLDLLCLWQSDTAPL